MTDSTFPTYCNDLHHYSRRISREVRIGEVWMGGHYPIRVQSMTTTDTMDTEATVAQSIRMIEAGCELVRITAPSVNEARNLENIKNELRRRGYQTPLVADIHFTPNAAEVAARIVEKVRVNPGNYADKKKFETIDYTDDAYQAELDRIRERFIPLIRICKEHGTAMRIGTNHGSLSDRILSRYGDTPLGMVESAMEFLRICEDEGYHDIVLSMKASNTQVMVQAYRLLVSTMNSHGMNYPLHLGVTEAGDGEDGRIKSAVGIGTLLEDGLGDTVRVSLTEDPEFEIPVAKALVERYAGRGTVVSTPLNDQEQGKSVVSTPLNDRPVSNETISLPYSPYDYARRHCAEALNIGGKQVPRVIIDFSHKEKLTHASLFPVGYQYSVPSDKWNLTDQACDFIYTGNRVLDFDIPGTLGVIVNSDTFANGPVPERHYPLFCAQEYFRATHRSAVLNFVAIDRASLDHPEFDLSKLDATVVLLADTMQEHGMADERDMVAELMRRGCDRPVILKRNYAGISAEQLQLFAATDFGGLFLDGMGDGVWIKAPGIASEAVINSTAFGLLQATRTRISKTEYISCPSCGRTLFDLQETTAKIRSRTDHLKGVKIGIMGCIVNGPGEMADADYGYVGTGPGKITLYKGREVVKRNLDESHAVDELIDLIRDHGDWVEKQ